MTPLIFTLLIAYPLTALCSSKEVCPQKKASCDEIKTADGYYHYFFNTTGTEIEVYHDEILIAHGTRETFEYRSEVVRMDMKSVVTKHCCDLRLKCIVPNGEFIKEQCWDYKVTLTETKSEPEPEPSVPLWKIIVGVVAGAVTIAAVLLLLFCIYQYISRTAWPTEQQSQATLPGFLGYLKSCTFVREGISQEEIGAGRETRGSEVHNGLRDHSDTQSINPELSPSNRDAISIDFETDGRTPEAPNPRCSRGTQLTNNITSDPVDSSSDGKIVMDIKPAWTHRAMDRKLRDDPGGLEGNNGNDINIGNRDKPDDRMTGDWSLEGRENEGQPLLCNKQTAMQDLNMAGEPAALVDKHGRDPDEAGMSSIGLVKGSSDVELPSLMKNINNSTSICIE